MQTKHLFDYDDYKSYVNDRLDASPDGRGSRANFARAIECQSAYVSSALRGKAHFTPEQAERVNAHFGHNENESDFFLLLLNFQRAGTEDLRRRLKKQMDKIRQSRFDLKKRLSQAQELSDHDRALFYSDWLYAAIHALVSIPGYQSATSIAQYLKITPAKASGIIEKLLEMGLLEQGKSGLKIGQSRTHLGSESPFITKHHSNWRLQAMHRMAAGNPENLHYSSVVTLSEKDAVRIKEKLVDLLKESKAIIKDSREETLQVFNIDFFAL